MKRHQNVAIWKYAVPIEDEFQVEMPIGAKVLSVQVQKEAVFMWAEVRTDNLKEMKTFFVVGTGHPMPVRAERYIGTFQLHGGDLVFHLYEEN